MIGKTFETTRLRPKHAWRLTALYFFLSVAWIVVTDAAVDFYLSSGPARATAQSTKGILFVLATTLFVFWLSRQAFSRVAAEAKTDLADSTQRLFNVVMANVGEAVIQVEPSTRTIVTCNAAVSSMFGYSVDELLGTPTRLLHQDEDAFLSFGKTSEPVLEAQGIFRCEWVLRHKDGHSIDVEITVVSLDQQLGWHGGVVSFIRDISDRKNVEAQLRQSEETYRLLAENTLDTIWAADMELVFTYVNPAISTLTGHTPSELVGTHMRQHVAEGDFETLKDLIDQEIAKGPQSAGVIVEIEILRKGRPPTPVEVHGKVLFDDSENPIAIQGSTRDISERRVLEAQLRRSQKLEAIGTFAGGIAHEINNPIMGISAFADLLAAERGADSMTREYCSEIKGQTDRVHTLISNLLGYARTDESRPLEPVALGEVVEATLSLIDAVIRHDGITLSADIPQALPLIRCRPQEIQQVVMNLVMNARDALNSKYTESDQGKRITIAGRRTTNEAGVSLVRLSVEDTGPGITEDVMERMFEPFFTTKQTGKGTGLGMWIVHQIVHEHRGIIGVESDLGEFTRFNVDLPAHGSPPEMKDEHGAL